MFISYNHLARQRIQLPPRSAIRRFTCPMGYQDYTVQNDPVYDYYSKFVSDSDKAQLYSLFNQGELYMRQTRERATLSLLKKLKKNDFATKHILEVGCGRGHQIGEYLRWGAFSENITGIDILPDFIEETKHRYPGVTLQQGSAMSLPYESDSFDIVSQSTVMSSLPSNSDRQKMASEMIRVLRPGGYILWSDFRYNSPNNQNVRRVTKSDINNLFYELEVHLQTTVLLPPLSRRIAPISHTLANLLNSIPLLRSHLRGVFLKHNHG